MGQTFVPRAIKEVCLRRAIVKHRGRTNDTKPGITEATVLLAIYEQVEPDVLGSS